jgi:hypothetical protein
MICVFEAKRATLIEEGGGAVVVLSQSHVARSRGGVGKRVALSALMSIVEFYDCCNCNGNVHFQLLHLVTNYSHKVMGLVHCHYVLCVIHMLMLITLFFSSHRAIACAIIRTTRLTTYIYTSCRLSLMLALMKSDPIPW